VAIHSGSTGVTLRWSIDQVPFGRIERERVVDDDELFYFLVGASFIEITSDLYTHSLIEYFDGDPVVTGWLRQEWEPQELQHGTALRRYVAAVWPEFDWPRAYDHFRRSYGPLCSSELFGPTRGLELAARCVVETGTATFYTMIRDLTDEPVLRQLANLIRTDEVAHYGHFLQSFKRYRDEEGLGRMQILRALLGRVTEIDDEDAWIAFRSVYTMTRPGEDAVRAYQQYRLKARERMRALYPYDLASTMLLRPLGLNRRLIRMIVPVLSAAARQLFLLEALRSRPRHLHPPASIHYS